MQPPQKTARWWNDKTIFMHHFTRSNYVTAIWNWFMMLAGKAAEPFLFASVLYSGYKLLPGVPPPSAGFDAGVFIAQQATLDIGGMGLMKLAQQANQSKDSFAYRVGFILVGLMIANVIVASIERLVPLGPAGTVIEGILLVARAVMAVLYGHAIHSLRGDENESTEVVKSNDVHTRLDGYSEQLQQFSARTEGRIRQLEANTERHINMIIDALRSLAANTDGRIASLAEKVEALSTTTETRIGALTEYLEQSEANSNDRIATVAEGIRSFGAKSNDRIAAMTEMITHASHTTDARVDALMLSQQQSGEHTKAQMIELAGHIRSYIDAGLATLLGEVQEQSEVLSDLSDLSAQFGQFEESTRVEWRTVTEEIKVSVAQQMQALPNTLDRIVNHVSNTSNRRAAPKPRNVKSKASIVEVPKSTEEFNKGEFVRQCLRDDPEISIGAIQRKALAMGQKVAASYVSDVRKAFHDELVVTSLNAHLDEGAIATTDELQTDDAMNQ